MKKLGKIVLLIAIVSQLFFGFLMFIASIPFLHRMHYGIIKLIEPRAFPPMDVYPNFNIHLSPIVLYMLICLGMTVSCFISIFFILHIVMNKRLKAMDKVMWIIVISIAHIIGLIIYWYMHIWKEPKFT